MDKLVIEGGHRLNGTVTISGAKNAALPIMAASLLTTGVNHLTNLPRLRDVETTIKLLLRMNAAVTWEDQNSLTIDTGNLTSFEAPYDLVRTMRASIVVLGPLLGRYGLAQVSLPGGCAIGTRPVDQHLKGLKQMGADIDIIHGYLSSKATKGLHGARILLDMPTVTGTENLMMAATLAKGETLIENAAKEPEVIDLADTLIEMGAQIEGAGTSRILIQGVSDLTPFRHSVIPDRIEAGTYIVAGAITNGQVVVDNLVPEHITSFLEKLREIGVSVEENGKSVTVSLPRSLQSVKVKTMPYPGFPTDLQAQLMALLCLAEGASTINETIFENRFMHVAELQRMGAKIRHEGAIATIEGVRKLSAAPLLATDLRASAALVLAALAAKGTSEIRRIYHLERGYENMVGKLKALGAVIERVSDTEEKF